MRTNNEKFIKNLSDENLTDQEITLLAKGPRFISTRPVPVSYKRLLQDFRDLTRSMRLWYVFANSKSDAHPFHVKSKWQPAPQPSVVLENHTERTKLEIASITFSNLTAKQRQAFKTLSASSKINLNKADKWTTTVIMDTKKTIHNLLTQSIESETVTRVKTIVSTLFTKEYIDEMTHMWQ